MSFYIPADGFASSGGGGGGGGGGNVNVIAVPYDGSGGAATFTSTAEISDGAIVTDVANVVAVAFNGTTPQVTVGVSGTLSKFLAAADTDLTDTTAPQENPQITTQSGAAAVVVTLTGAGITLGSGTIYLTYAIPVS